MSNTTNPAPLPTIYPWPAERSGQIAGTGYDAATKTLHVAFKGSGSYVYEGVPAEVASALDSSPSAGQFLARSIKGRYPHRRA